MTDAPRLPRARRQPPPFREAAVTAVEHRTPRLVRVTLAGPELDGLHIDQPAASVRLLLPSEAGDRLTLPTWTGNEFRLPSGARPVLRTFTPRRLDPDRPELDVEIVIHGAGPAAAWASTVTPGARAAVSGPGRGYVVDVGADAFLLAGDETAVPAISQLLEVLPPVPVDVHLEAGAPDAHHALPAHPGASVTWHDLAPGAAPGDTLLDAVRGADLGPTTRVWAAGEAAGVQRLRRHLFEDRGVPRDRTWVRGYWRLGRGGDDREED